MLRLLADENFNGRILRALRRQIPNLDVVRAQDTALYGTDDQTLLQFAAVENRIILTHDVETWWVTPGRGSVQGWRCLESSSP